MRDIADYMTESREYRRQHLNLTLPCNEYGGNGSTEFKGLLAYHVGTTIPSRGNGYKIHLCHACGNGACSNVAHLYWGTPKDNTQDAIEHGTWISQYERTLAKHGVEGMKAIAAKAGAASAKTKALTSAGHWESYRPFYDGVDFTKRGWCQRLKERMGCSHTHVRRIAKHLNLI